MRLNTPNGPVDLDPVEARALLTSIPLFRGFPYLSTRILGALHHLMLLPERDEATLLAWARIQRDVNRLPTALVLGDERAVFLAPEGSESRFPEAPRASWLVSDAILPTFPLELAPGDRDRVDELARMVATGKEEGNRYILPSPTMGGRLPTSHDLRSLTAPPGSFPGLERCSHCGDMQGRVLESRQGFRPLVYDVHCRCDAWNRCGACGQLFHPHRLESSSWDEDEGRRIPHPAWHALTHRKSCRGGTR